MAVRIAGHRRLLTPPGSGTRPTPAKVRQAVFNIWQGRLRGCRWLDLFAGSGAMTATALTQGVELAIAIEQSRPTAQLVAANLQAIAPTHQWQVLTGSVQHHLPTLAGQQFDFIYCDPPYASNLYSTVVSLLGQYQLLAPGGEIALEHPTAQPPVLPATDWEVCRQKKYGSVSLTFLLAADRPQKPATPAEAEVAKDLGSGAA
jgi:16S rRNA (guanine966-N2)-methyltransferase